MLKRIARWGDAAFYAGIVAAAGLLRPHTTVWYAGLGEAYRSYRRATWI